MSLINDALKKAARQRAQEADFLPPMPGGGPRPSRGSHGGKPQSMAMIAISAVAVAVVSAVGTGIYMANRPEPKPVAAVMRPTPLALSQAPAPQISLPPIKAPVIQPPVAQAAATPLPSPVRTKEAPQPQALALSAAPTPTAAPRASEPAPAATSATIISQSDRVQGFIDGLHVTGVRYSQNGGKALVDGHIYRVNDVMDKALGVRLTKIDEDHLTFTDPTGATYVKSF